MIRSLTSFYPKLHHDKYDLKGFDIVDGLKEKFGKRLRFIRRQKDLTQEQLAELVGLSVEFISNIERGINSPSFSTLEKLEKVLHMPVSEMFRFPD
jgi:DNA-binding XRE family transcriptional regulator